MWQIGPDLAEFDRKWAEVGGKGSGRPGKPTHLKILEGERPDRINNSEPVPDEAEIVCPSELSERARKVWDRLAPDLIAKKVLTAWDVPMFAVFCNAVATYWENNELMAGEYTARGAAGGVIKSPHWQIMRDAAGIMTSVGSRFGLTPSDRSSLKLDAEDPKGSGAERLLS
ncbi:phage terminase small subunit P27 family [Nocardia africana]